MYVISVQYDKKCILSCSKIHPSLALCCCRDRQSTKYKIVHFTGEVKGILEFQILYFISNTRKSPQKLAFRDKLSHPRKVFTLNSR